MKITTEQILKMERTARRNADIECQIPRVKHTIQKSKKEYSRQQNKKLAKTW